MGQFVQFGNSPQLGFAVATAMTAVKIAGPIAKFFKRLIPSGGHKDDWIDNEEEQIAAETLAPIITAAGVPLAWPFRWPQARQAANSINPATSPMSPQEAREIIERMDPLIADRCSAYAEAGYPCPPATSGKKSGAGRDIKPLWQAIRSKLVQISQRKFSVFSSSAAGSSTLPGGIPAESLLPWGLAAAGIIGAAIFAARK